MYFVRKRLEIAAAHSLSLNYGSKCSNLHGHNWIMTIYCKAEKLNENGMVVDFSHIKDMLNEKMDHNILNKVFDFNPTAENLARWVVENVPNCYRAEIQESEDNFAAYEI